MCNPAQKKKSKNQGRRRQLRCAKWNTAGKEQGEEGGRGLERARTREEKKQEEEAELGRKEQGAKRDAAEVCFTAFVGFKHLLGLRWWVHSHFLPFL